MTHVVTDNCVDCRYTTCVSDCPVDAFKSHDRMLIIDPALCIDCSMCIDLCPVNAIVTDNTDIVNLDDLVTYAENASKVWPPINKVDARTEPQLCNNPNKTRPKVERHI